MELSTRPEAPVDGAGIAIATALGRLEETIGSEDAVLASGDRRAIEEVIQRKSRSLLELTKLSRAQAGRPLGVPGFDGRIGAIRETLSRNAALLELHLNASREVGDLIAASLAHEDWDGTYAAPGGPAGGGRR